MRRRLASLLIFCCTHGTGGGCGCGGCGGNNGPAAASHTPAGASLAASGPGLLAAERLDSSRTHPGQPESILLVFRRLGLSWSSGSAGWTHGNRADEDDAWPSVADHKRAGRTQPRLPPITGRAGPGPQTKEPVCPRAVRHEAVADYRPAVRLAGRQVSRCRGAAALERADWRNDGGRPGVGPPCLRFRSARRDSLGRCRRIGRRQNAQPRMLSAPKLTYATFCYKGFGQRAAVRAAAPAEARGRSSASRRDSETRRRCGAVVALTPSSAPELATARTKERG